MKKIFSLILVLVLIMSSLSALVACGSTEADINLAITSTPRGLDFNQGSASIALETMGAQLIMRSPEGTEYQPYVLAKVPEFSDDGLTMTLTFPTGYKFHTGEELTFADVTATFDHVKANASAYGFSVVNNFASYTEGETTADTFEVVVTLTKIDPAILDYFASPMSAILSSKALTEKGAAGFASSPVYYGLFYVSEFISNGYILYTRNDNFKCSDDNTIIDNHGKAYVETIKWKVISDFSLQMRAVSNGTLDAAAYVPITHYGLIEAQEAKGTLKINRQSGFNQGLSVGTKADSVLNATTDVNGNGIEDGLDLRRAITVGLDREAIAGTLGNKNEGRIGAYNAYDLYSTNKTVGAPTFTSDNSTLRATLEGKTHEENVKYATDMIESLGYTKSGDYYQKNGVELKLDYIYYSLGVGNTADVMTQTSFREMGINLVLNVGDFYQLMKPRLTDGEFDIVSWASGTATSGITALSHILSTDSEGTPQYYYYNIPELNETFAELVACSDLASQQAVAEKINNIMTWDECRMIYTFQPIEYGVASSRIVGWKTIGDTDGWDWKILNDLKIGE